MDNKNLLSYQILIVVGVFFFTSSVFSSYLMKTISPKIILSMRLTNNDLSWKYQQYWEYLIGDSERAMNSVEPIHKKFMQSLLYFVFASCIRYCQSDILSLYILIWKKINRKHDLMLSILLSLGVWLLLSTLSSFAINAMTEFNPIVISFVMFLSCCCCANIVMADAVNLFPTSHRGMATSFIFMLGRLGAFAGSNVVGALLVNLCTSIFYLYGGLLIGKFSLQNLWPL